MKTKLFLVFTTMIFSLNFSFGQPFETEWEKQPGGNIFNSFTDVAENPDGSFTVLGLIDKKGVAGHDLWLIKFSNTGDTLWSKTYSREGADLPVRLAIHPLGGYLAAIINRNKSDEIVPWVIKMDDGGNEIWRKDYDTSTETDRTDIAVNKDGSWWWMNTVKEADKPAMVRLSLMDDNGLLLSEYSFAEKQEVHAHAIKLLPDQTIAVSGQIDQGKGTSGMWVMRANAAGELLWKTVVPASGKKISPECICCTPDKHLVVAGWIGSCMNPDAGADDQIFEWDLALVKINEAGKLTWMKNFDREGSEGGNAVAVLPDGNIMIAGKCETSFTGTIGPWLILADKTGKQLFDQVDRFRFNGDQASRIILASDGSLVMVGPGRVQEDARKATGWIKKMKSPVATP